METMVLSLSIPKWYRSVSPRELTLNIDINIKDKLQYLYVFERGLALLVALQGESTWKGGGGGVGGHN